MSSLDFVHHGYPLTVGRRSRCVFPVALGCIDFTTIFIQTGWANTQRRNCSILYRMNKIVSCESCTPGYRRALPPYRPACSHSIRIQSPSRRLPGLPYAASKAALRSFAHTWTSALQDRKIRVNVLNSCGIAAAAQDLLPPGAQEIYAQDGSLREAKMVTVPGINHLMWCAGRRLRNDGHSLPVL
jgi:NAD(P)-dependent dehydrogenase (short-subunit alcohol dehydrogenase family)